MATPQGVKDRLWSWVYRLYYPPLLETEASGSTDAPSSSVDTADAIDGYPLSSSSATTTTNSPTTIATNITSSEAAMLISTSSEAAMSTSTSPEAAMTTSTSPEAATITTIFSPEAATTTTFSPEAATTTTFSPEAATTTSTPDLESSVAVSPATVDTVSRDADIPTTEGNARAAESTSTMGAASDEADASPSSKEPPSFHDVTLSPSADGLLCKTIITTGTKTTSTSTPSTNTGARSSTTSSSPGTLSTTNAARQPAVAPADRPDLDLSPEDVENIVANAKEAAASGDSVPTDDVRRDAKPPPTAEGSMTMTNTDNASGNVQARAVDTLSQHNISLAVQGAKNFAKKKKGKAPGSTSKESSDKDSDDENSEADESHRTDGGQQDQLPVKVQPVGSRVPPLCEMKVKDEQLHVALISDDILHSGADVIVTGEDPSLQGYGEVSQRLLEFGKKGYRRQRDQLLEENGGTLERGRVYVTRDKVGDFLVAHAVLELRSRTTEQEWDSSTTSLYSAAVRQALEGGCRSMAIPVLGSGTGRAPAERAVRAALHGLETADVGTGRSQLQVFLFSKDDSVLELAKSEMMKRPGYVMSSRSS